MNILQEPTVETTAKLEQEIAKLSLNERSYPCDPGGVHGGVVRWCIRSVNRTCRGRAAPFAHY